MNEDQRLAQLRLEDAHEALEDIADFHQDGMTASHKDWLARARRLIESVLNDLDRLSPDRLTRLTT